MAGACIDRVDSAWPRWGDARLGRTPSRRGI